jgi:hypothetical protein
VSYFNHRGIFLQKLGPTPVDPDEVLVSMQFALKQSGWDAENRADRLSAGFADHHCVVL